MTERAEVEALLAEVSVYTGRKSGLIAELCHLWLAVQDAPLVEVTREDWLENCTQFGADLIGQRVRLVRDGGES